MSVTEIRGPRVTLRAARPDDADALAVILAEPEVACWWGRYDAGRVRREIGEVNTYVIVVGGATAGWLHVSEENEPDYRHASLDIALTTRLHGQGLGRETLRLVIDHLVASGHHRFTIDPACANERAIRSYTAVGFKPVGVLRDYERGLDGRWHDGLLMDLLADELTGAEPP
jgi:aminoglycoside 6'-N-acetyltransferase